MKSVPFALYDAFAEVPFGGSPAAVFTDAAGLDAPTRRAIAREIGAPATAFVDDCGNGRVTAQFLSTVMELPMCGHGTLCLMTHLLETGGIAGGGEFELRLPAGNARVNIERRDDGRRRVMLDVRPPRFEAAPPLDAELPELLGVDAGTLDPGLPPEIARGDFVHLLLPFAGLGTVRALQPDFGAIVDFCRRHGIETVAAFCREAETPGHGAHLRDFCPAVGVSESAAAGTTNAALAAYLQRQGLLTDTRGAATLLAEQGLELGRPSSIRSRLSVERGAVVRLQVGGVARKVMAGRFYL